MLREVSQVIANSSDQTIQLIMVGGRNVDIKVNLCKIALDTVNNLVYLYDSSTSNTVVGSDIFEPNFYSLDFNLITNPSTGSAADLYSAVRTILAEAMGGGGDATAANQVIGNNYLSQIEDYTAATYSRYVNITEPSMVTQSFIRYGNQSTIAGATTALAAGKLQVSSDALGANLLHIVDTDGDIIFNGLSYDWYAIMLAQ